MIIVNNQGDWSHVYTVLRHASWHGLLGADVIFPFFLFIMGVSIFHSLSGKKDRRSTIVWKIILRSVVLFLLGIILNLFPDFNFGTLRIPGILQRISICYLAAGLIFLFSGIRTQAIICAALLLLYWIILAPPGAGTDSLDQNGNICQLADRALLAGHVYAKSTSTGLDPEGILSTIPSVSSTMIGAVFAGFMKKKVDPARRLVFTSLISASLIILGLCLGHFMPINKNLWTPTYALITGGAASAVLIILHAACDLKGHSSWGLPFTILGMNSITVFFLSSLSGKAMTTFRFPCGVHANLKSFLTDALSGCVPDPYSASLLYSVLYLLFWTCAMYCLYKRNIFIKI
ncbi:MAG: hypothetical protein MUD12_06075 [Spirochaetes bacterium]|nr:hypothetical protein [Spirochaetota bacterium]